MNAVEQLEELRTLKPGWDGDDSLPPKPELIDAAKAVFMKIGKEPTRILPKYDGGITIKWASNAGYTVLRIDSPDVATLSYFTSAAAPAIHSAALKLPLESTIRIL